MELAAWVRGQPQTVQNLAVVLGIGRVSLHRIMAGRNMPRACLVSKIAILTAGAVTANDLSACNIQYRAGRA